MRNQFVKVTVRTWNGKFDTFYFKPEHIEHIEVIEETTRIYFKKDFYCSYLETNTIPMGISLKFLKIRETPEQLFKQEFTEKFNDKIDKILGEENEKR